MLCFTPLSRRLSCCLLLQACFCCAVCVATPIDREQVVRRHNVITSGTLVKSPAQVGNGKFAFGMDITGLQTFVPFNTMSDWGWHSFPLPEGKTPEMYKPTVITHNGQTHAYFLPDANEPELSDWMRANPHRINLARIGFVLYNEDGSEATEQDLKCCHQVVDLWTGVVRSYFEVNGKGVTVVTACHPTRDQISVSVRSTLLRQGRIKVFVSFPYADRRQFPFYIGAYHEPEAHATQVVAQEPFSASIVHHEDSLTYHANLAWEGAASFGLSNHEAHRYELEPEPTTYFAFNCDFSPEANATPPTPFKETERLSTQAWEQYWQSGAAVDFSGSRDERWRELERRVVLSQYLMRVNECGLLPPQESGLVNNGWFGRFHFEMIWWHGVHYALWNRMPLFDNYLHIYRDYLPTALERARIEGRKGAHWPKCTGNFNREWPCDVHAFLIWQQPHPIYFAEADYRIHPDAATLDKWKDIVMHTADFLADYPVFDPATQQYNLDAPMIVVSENTKAMETVNPIFELAYLRYGLRTALTWAERLKLPEKRVRQWRKVLNGLAPLPQQEGVYTTYEGIPDLWTHRNYEHPALIGVYGMLPGDGVDMDVFRRTLDRVGAEWQFRRVWGWDFPMLAMAAARTGQPELALHYLLYDTPNFRFDEHGLASGGPYPYFPSNGGLLTAVAMMCGGWDGTEGQAPGFPNDGSWTVRYEGFNPMQ